MDVFNDERAPLEWPNAGRCKSVKRLFQSHSMLPFYARISDSCPQSSELPTFVHAHVHVCRCCHINRTASCAHLPISSYNIPTHLYLMHARKVNLVNITTYIHSQSWSQSCLAVALHCRQLSAYSNDPVFALLSVAIIMTSQARVSGH